MTQDDDTEPLQGNTKHCGCRSTSMGDHVSDVSDFLDISKHRSEAQDLLNVSVDHNIQMEEHQDHRSEQGNRRDPCGTDQRVFYAYDWRAFEPLLDIEHEIEIIDDDERQRSIAQGRPLPQLRIIGDLALIEDPGPFEADGNLMVEAVPPGGLPPDPLDKKPIVSLIGGTTILKPKGPIVGGILVDPPKPPPLGFQTSDYWCPPADSYWHYGARARRLTTGASKCKDTRVDRIRQAFYLAYQVIRSAEQEIMKWEDQPTEEKKYMWHASKQSSKAALGYWFGDADADEFDKRFKVVAHILTWWSYAFRYGFYQEPADLPVLFKCKSWKDTHSALHAELNVIELHAAWFQAPAYDAWTAQVILHEMGHYSMNKFLATWPMGTAGIIWGASISHSFPYFLDDQKDEERCPSGEDHKCYGDDHWLGVWKWPEIYASLKNGPFEGPPFIGVDMGDSNFQMLLSPRPRKLVDSFENGSVLAFNRMLYNVDNYVSYMWNRWLDHGYCRLNLRTD